MTMILIPTRVRYAFRGGVGEVIRMLGAVAPACGHRCIDLDGITIGGPRDCRIRTPWVVFTRRLLHLRTLAFFGSVFPRTPLVFFQTSLNRNALVRDAAYMRRCWRAGRPFSVFFHGWNEHFADTVSNSPRRRSKLAELLNQAKKIFVLAPSFAETLALWGVDPQKLVIETTMIDDSILNGFDLQEKIRSRISTGSLKILFMSRIVKEKGIYLALEAFKLHRNRFPESTLVIAGDGEGLRALKEKVHQESIEGVRFTGFVEGSRKTDLLADADVFLFPSFYGEGLPVSVLEAMAFGCTVISRPVGGLGSVFRAPEMGFLEQSLDPKRYAELLEDVTVSPELWVTTAKFNHRFARENMVASRVCRRILNEVTKQ